MPGTLGYAARTLKPNVSYPISNIRFAMLKSILSTMRYAQRTLHFLIYIPVFRLCPTFGALMFPAVPSSLLW